MKRLLILAILFVGLFSAISANAQTDLKGSYIYKVKNGENSSDFYLKFEREDSVYYSYAYNGYGTLGGKWTLENGIIKAVLTRGDENWTLKLKQKGGNLEIAETLPEKGLSDIPDFKKILPVGTVFKKMDDTPSGLELTPEEIGKRVTKLIKSIKSQNDLSAENLEKQIGMKVSFSKKNPKEFGVGGEVTGAPDWFYGFGGLAHTIEGIEKIGRLDFSFNYQLHEPLNPDTTTVCKAFDFDSLSKELQADGFSAPQPLYQRHSRLSGWSFTRGKVSVTVHVKGGWEPNVDKCVEMILISVAG